MQVIDHITGVNHTYLILRNQFIIIIQRPRRRKYGAEKVGVAKIAGTLCAPFFLPGPSAAAHGIQHFQMAATTFAVLLYRENATTLCRRPYLDQRTPMVPDCLRGNLEPAVLISHLSHL